MPPSRDDTIVRSTQKGDQTFMLRPISQSDADALRLGGGPVYVADECPGYPCRQCLRDAAIGDELKDHMISKTALGRIGRPDDIAAAVCKIQRAWSK